MKLYTESEVKKLIKAYEERYPSERCDPLPYYPESIEVELSGQVVATLQETPYKPNSINPSDTLSEEDFPKVVDHPEFPRKETFHISSKPNSESK